MARLSGRPAVLLCACVLLLAALSRLLRGAPAEARVNSPLQRSNTPQVAGSPSHAQLPLTAVAEGSLSRVRALSLLASVRRTREAHEEALRRTRRFDAELRHAAEQHATELHATQLHQTLTPPTLTATATRTPIGAMGGAPRTLGCVAGCSRHGNCNLLTGECVCGLTHRGESCNEPTMPSCSLGSTNASEAEGGSGHGRSSETINLSGLVSERFWDQMRDLTTNHPYRTSPPIRWLGAVPCGCVREAVAVFSIANAAEPARWPRMIGITELAMQRVVCVEEGGTVGELWRRGSARRTLRWGVVPVLAWLKMFPAHGPMLLPEGLISADEWMSPPHPHVHKLRGGTGGRQGGGRQGGGHQGGVRRRGGGRRLSKVVMVPPPPMVVSKRPALATEPSAFFAAFARLEGGGPTLLPLAECDEACHGAGWCGAWTLRGGGVRPGGSGRGGAAASAPRCHCLSAWLDESHELHATHRRAEKLGAEAELPAWLTDEPPPHSTGRMARAASVCTPRPRAWRDGLQHAHSVSTYRDAADHDADADQYGADFWRASVRTLPRTKSCPNECLGFGTCRFGWCHCERGRWGLDCGFSLRGLSLGRGGKARVEGAHAQGGSSDAHGDAATANGGAALSDAPRPRIYMYEVPAGLRRSCGPWRFPEDLGDALLRSPYVEPRAERADLYWIYGCPNGDTVNRLWSRHAPPPRVE